MLCCDESVALFLVFFVVDPDMNEISESLTFKEKSQIYKNDKGPCLRYLQQLKYCLYASIIFLKMCFWCHKALFN